MKLWYPLFIGILKSTAITLLVYILMMIIDGTDKIFLLTLWIVGMSVLFSEIWEIKNGLH